MILKKTIISALTGILLLGGAVGVSQSANAATVNDPGPVGDFSWEGFNWDKRTWNGSPHYNGQYSANNVSNPDANGYVKLSLSNPTGNAPVAAEFQSTRRGFGYGTYSTTVEKNINSLQKETVWGCLFTYDPDAAPGMNEIDLCEASAWGGGAAWGESWPVTQGHGYWFDASKGPGLGNNTTVFPVSSSPILTHKMVWEPGKITFDTYEGEGYTGTLLKRTVLQGSNVPVPAKEHVIFNLWVTGGGGGNPNQVKPESVTIRDFSFLPAGAATQTSTPAPTVTPTAIPTATATSSATPTTPTTPTVSPTVAPTAIPPATTPVTASPTATPTSTRTPAPTTTGTPAPTPATSPIQLSSTSVKYKSGYRTTLKWTGTSETNVFLYVNGVKKTILNSGAAVVDVAKGSTTSYKLCDSKGCSAVMNIKVAN